MNEREDKTPIERPSETERRRGKDNPPNRNNPNNEDARNFDAERYRY